MNANLILEEKNKTLDSLNTKSDFIRLKSIVENDDIQLSVKKFFITEIDIRIFGKALKANADEYFDFSNNELIEKTKEIEPLMRENARFERLEFLQKLDLAIKLALKYSIAPTATMAEFIYNGINFRAVKELRIFLNYFADYNYLTDGVIGRLEQFEGDKALSVYEFQNIVYQVDKEYVTELYLTEFVELLTPIFERLGNKAGRVKIDFLIMFFNDKFLGAVARGLELYKDNNSIDTINKEELSVYLEEFLKYSDTSTYAIDEDNISENSDITITLESEGQLNEEDVMQTISEGLDSELSGVNIDELMGEIDSENEEVLITEAINNDLKEIDGLIYINNDKPIIEEPQTNSAELESEVNLEILAEQILSGMDVEIKDEEKFYSAEMPSEIDFETARLETLSKIDSIRNTMNVMEREYSRETKVDIDNDININDKIEEFKNKIS